MSDEIIARMELQRDSRLGYGFLLVGAALPYLVDKLFGSMATLISLAVILLIGIVLLISAHHSDIRGTFVMTIFLFALYGAGIGGLGGGIVGAISHLRAESDTKPSAKVPARHVFSDPRPDAESAAYFGDIPADGLTLRDLYAHDFTDRRHVYKAGGVLTADNPPEGVPPSITYYIVMEEESHSKYVQFYIPYSRDVPGILRGLAEHFSEVLNLNGINFQSRAKIGDAMTYDTKDFVFTGQVYVYSEADLNIDSLSDMSKDFREHNLQLQFRSHSYLESERMKKRILALQLK